MNQPQKTFSISFTMHGQIPLHKQWLSVERDEQHRFVLVPTEKTSLWEKQFADKFQSLESGKIHGDANLKVVLYTRKDSKSLRLSHTILKVVEKWCIDGAVRNWSVEQRPAESIIDVRSEFTISSV